MKTPIRQNQGVHQQTRRGSTLVIVIALLGLLAFTGMVFFAFSSQERSAAEYFAEAAKNEVDELDNVWDHPLRQVISGTNNKPSDRFSILGGNGRRHSIVTNMVGSDLAPHSGEGVNVVMEGGLPAVDMNGDGKGSDEPGNQSLLNYVDSPAVWGGNTQRPDVAPAPDVDYTYPDINNMFLAYRGWAIRDNQNGTFERVPIIIPSFMRPALLKTSAGNGFGGHDAPTDVNWAQAFNGTNRNTAKFGQRSFRPHPSHIVGNPETGAVTFRYLTDAEAASLGILSGGFPFVPEDNLVGQPGGLNGVRGEMGVWTGSVPDAYELDADNDNDGLREGIWIDTHFPVQEYVDGSGTTKMYVVLHSFTIYDLDGLINLTVHGNVARWDRNGSVSAIGSSTVPATQMMSASSLGLGPNEVNPLWALRANVANLKNSGLTTYDLVRAQFQYHYGINPTAASFNELSQANMEWFWLMAGRASVNLTGTMEDIFVGRWGEANRLFTTYRNGGSFVVADLPRPGRSGNAQNTLSSGTRYGGQLTTNGRDGFDDNLDSREGEVNLNSGRLRPFGTPMDYAGVGRITRGEVGNYDTLTGTFATTGTDTVSGLARDIRLPVLHHDTTSTGPERYLRFLQYSLGRDLDTTASRYIFGQNGNSNNLTAASDDLLVNAALDALFEDPLETIFDPDLSQGDFDAIFGPQDLFALHLPAIDISSSPDDISLRLKDLAPYSLDDANAPFSFNEQTTPGVRGRFTTLSNSLHRFLGRSPFGRDGRPGIAGVDDNNDGVVDNIADLTDTGTSFVAGAVTAQGGDTDDVKRAWEFSADTDGLGTGNSGFPNGDGFYEFPPSFGSTTVMGLPYSGTDPFRPQVRRLLSLESGENRGLAGQMPLSPNHLLDVERNAQTPEEGTPAFLRYMQRAGMRFRQLTDHPQASEGNTVLSLTAIPTWSAGTPVPFPPQTPAQREFWARRDRQKLARDIYVLLYTTGGAAIDPANTSRIRDYRVTNNPSADQGSSLYTHAQLRRMAQFAVNLVDAMDSDNVITKFEYDKNLGPDASGNFGGWNLDDNPQAVNAVNATLGYAEDGPSADPVITENGLYREDGLERGVVYGVEGQELAFSEVFAATSPNFGTTQPDSAQTLHDDTNGDLNFLQVELQNLRPTTVPMATTVTGTTNEERAIWQIARYDRTGANAIEAAAPTQTLTLMEGNAPVPGAGQFTIGMVGKPGDAGNTNPTGWGTADLYIDYDNDMDFERISPDIGNASVNTGDAVTPSCTLDVVSTTHTGRWLATGNSTAPGQFLDAMTGSYGGNNAYGLAPMTGNDGFDLVLRRRANPNMPQLPLTDNPWVEVDRCRVAFNDLFTVDMTAATLVLDQARSEERPEPLSNQTTVYPTDHGSDPNVQAWRFNTLGSATNESSVAGFDLVQYHFDREYASTGELLNLPLVGPKLLTSRMERSRRAPFQQMFDDFNAYPPTTTPSLRLASSSESMFLQPDFPNLSAADATALNGTVSTRQLNSSLDNRWYRLLQFVEVPSRVHRMLGNYLAQQKTPGKININMVRHREVLAGLLDNPYIANVPKLADANGNSFEDGPFMTSATTLGGRDTWQSFIDDRDGSAVFSWDPAASAPRPFWLPGTPNANPFRSFAPGGFGIRSDNSFDETLLRRMRGDRDDDGDGLINESTGYTFDADGVQIVRNDMNPNSAVENTTNRHWLELADPVLHANPNSVSGIGQMSNATTRHQILSKIMNNTTTVSNCFIVYGTAAYFEAYEDPTTGLVRVGGRLDLDGDGDETNDQQRAVFVIDRTDAFEAYDAGSGDFDWKRLVKARVTIE